MVSSETLVALLGSAVAASFITAYFAKLQSDKSAIIENIIKERKAWRDKLRNLVSYVESCYKENDSNGLTSVEAQLAVLLNPYDEEDLLIIEALRRIHKDKKWQEEDLEEFIDRIAYLLKHDWERVKQESTTRISPQTLAIASLFVGLMSWAAESLYAWEPSLQTVKWVAFALTGTFFCVALIANLPNLSNLLRAPSRVKRILCWINNEPFREQYRNRSERGKGNQRI